MCLYTIKTGAIYKNIHCVQVTSVSSVMVTAKCTSVDTTLTVLPELVNTIQHGWLHISTVCAKSLKWLD